MFELFETASHAQQQVTMDAFQKRARSDFCSNTGPDLIRARDFYKELKN
jgi:hypothetical protein